MTESMRRLMELNGLTEEDMVKQTESNDASAEIEEIREALEILLSGRTE